ncbi:hypothetical protein E6P09_01800 [Haloferax mediterranei ATCC 33500]|uniref:DUF2238 domain-containing protein n=1 Tax=Haloferax mediterranei (strain ATCC 33500 / DSM 1411 / JCM 8866 / NBRC 14739 / NCIMB 2177 / R-4) TaxID=523841 RepID=I3R611_HALMT|nr:hypothetical protein [Haloferax mediterranei]AFK19671.1 hypothetical protein HFX_1978 [Haloferax mediterranei ATCC 33500]AHZ23060.1 hypothetical protein BM92_10620 [Haloferax mediterranei ATCC 33500]ELZ99991.1 hypothetical protein C439_11668 [Haloferax mediterranei ATCC 33500]MDX5987587.1 hypothetical protein [Haloferax mediterranei ATCC 33500]QCQ74076.1 hypothetical protein E6P09_01800 [Haloferax mediterranei ATCC 33500]
MWSQQSERVVGRAIQLAICLIFFAGVYTRNLSVLVNAVVALSATFLPAILRRDWQIRLHPFLGMWLAMAVLLHAIGMLGPYHYIDWWDHVTHTLSATVVAAVGYTTARAIDEYSDAVYFPDRFMFVYILLFTLAAGVFWEVLEFGARLAADAVGMEAILVQYGLGDTIIDLVFDSVGAALVALFGTSPLTETIDSLTEHLERTRT